MEPGYAVAIVLGAIGLITGLIGIGFSAWALLEERRKK